MAIRLASCGQRVRPGSPRIERWRSSDIEEHAGLISGHGHVYYQLAPGPFEGGFASYVLSGRSTIYVEHTNKRIRKQANVPPRHLNIGFLDAENAQHCINGEVLSGQDFHVSLAMTELDLQYAANLQEYRWCWLTLNHEDVVRLTTLRQESPDLRRPGRSQVNGGATQLLQNVIAMAEKDLFRLGSPQPLAATIGAFERTILSIAAWILTEAFERRTTPVRVNVASRARMLRRACEAIDAKLGHGLTVSELCSIVGASRRTLETVFLESLGLSPYHYVRTLRLNVIRKDLLAEQNAGASIGDIAAKYGVWHLSRFAADYRRMFGQSPSESRNAV